MSQSFHQNMVHIVFSTKHRRQTIAAEIEQRLHAYLDGIIRNEGGKPITIGGTDDHVHILACTPKNVTNIQFMQHLKGNSSKWVHETFPKHGNLYWQSGYGWFSVSTSLVAKVSAYIESQKEHHRTMTFQEEFIKFLKKHGIEYDERYIWD